MDWFEMTLFTNIKDMIATVHLSDKGNKTKLHNNNDDLHDEMVMVTMVMVTMVMVETIPIQALKTCHENHILLYKTPQTKSFSKLITLMMIVSRCSHSLHCTHLRWLWLMLKIVVNKCCTTKI